MTERSKALVDVDDVHVNPAFREDVLAGLAQEQKAVPARWLYDDEGSRLFEAITRLPEYYPTQAEIEILQRHGDAFRRLITPGAAIIEFGSGSSLKTPLLLRCIEPAAYVPLDISGDFLRASAAALASDFPGLPVYPVEADFMKRVHLPAEVDHLPKLGFFPGSTIGNMIAPTAVDLLRLMRKTLGPEAQFLIGMDLIKDPSVLHAAYEDAQGVTAEFNLNLARRINRELGGTIPLDKLHHVARWNDTWARIEMHLDATEAIEFEVSGCRFSMAEGETIHTENSHKFDRRSQFMLLLAGGWTPLERWLDSQGRFSLILAQATRPRAAP